MKRILFIAVVLALFTTAASAQGKNRAQHHRIQNGFNSGQLTRGEKFRLHNNQARYNHVKRQAFRDRRLTPAERRRLIAMKRHDNRRVYVMKHNARRRLF